MQDYYSGEQRGPHHAGGGRMPYGLHERGHGWGAEYERGGGMPGRGGLPHAWYELLWSEEFADAVLRVCREKMDETLASQGYYPAGMQGAGYGAEGGGYDYGKHRRFKEVLEELRELPTAEAQRQMAGRFASLNEEQKRVLSVLMSESSKKKLAQKASLSPERFMQVKHELEDKLK